MTQIGTPGTPGTAAPAAPAAPQPKPQPSEDLGVRLARGTLPHVTKLLADAHAQGPQLAWKLHLDPSDAESKAILDKLVGRIKAWEQVRAGFLADPTLPAELVAQFPGS